MCDNCNPSREEQCQKRCSQREEMGQCIDEAEVYADVLNMLDRFVTAAERIADDFDLLVEAHLNTNPNAS